MNRLGIKLAFGSNNFIHEFINKNKSYLGKIKSLLSTNQSLIHSVKIVKPEMAINLFENSLIPESVILLLIKRNEQEFYIYYSGLKLEQNDEMFFLSNEKDYSILKKLFES